MVKTIGLVAVAAVAALVLGFGSHLGSSSTPTAHADTTAISTVGCELLASAIDGDTTNNVVPGDYVDPCFAGITPADVTNLADALGDKDGTLEASDLTDIEGLDGNQLGENCTAVGVSCTLDVFVFVNNEGTVTFDAPTGLTFAVNVDPASNDWTCDTNAEDADCNSVPPNDGDGVVIGMLINATAARGDVKTITVTQNGVSQTDDINVVGVPNNVSLALVENVIETNGSSSKMAACTTDTDVTDAIDPPESTLAVATVTDQDDVSLTRIIVDWQVKPPSADDNIVSLGVGDQEEAITGNTAITVHPNTAGAPDAAYRVVCGGKTTGTATIKAVINEGTAAEDSSSQDITVGGAPDAIALTASPAQIKCDGTETSSVTAKVTDSAGNNVADGVPVEFSVVALGTANPIDTTTKDGSATTTVTPLSNSSAGVTVIVTAGSKQASIRVDCTLPLVTQPTLAPPPVASPTAIGITGPNTGTGGYLGQSDSSSFPMWTLIVLGLASVTLVGGGLLARRAGK